MSNSLFICLYDSVAELTQSLTRALGSDRYILQFIDSAPDWLQFIRKNKERIDCLIIEENGNLLPVFNKLHEEGILLPLLIIEGSQNGQSPSKKQPTYLYHSAEVKIRQQQIAQIASSIEKAIAEFLNLGRSTPVNPENIDGIENYPLEENQNFLLLQQHRLAEKLRERLGYLGVYYKRKAQSFYRNLPPEEKEELISSLNEQYRQIILCYFTDDHQTNKLIDEFVNQAFFADISVSKVLEIHMKLMDEFAQQLKLEGRNEEILLDYRLALIDIIAHLCEMYRRSIPREETWLR